MSNVNKVKCANGHFFDMNRFSICPICGAGGADTASQEKPPVEPSRKMDPVDKTERLGETPDITHTHALGKAGGINWIFDRKHKRKQEAEQKVEPAVQPEPAPQPEPEPPVQEEKPEVQADPAPQPEPQPEPQPQPVPVPRQEPPATGNSLLREVAATGHGATSALPKTVAFYNFADTETEPPTGWLVCVKGTHQGQAFACKAGRNKIGRNPDCNINPVNDTSITREPHAIIIYDPKERVFYLQNGTGDGLVYCNGAMLFSHERLKAYDKIELGNAEFVFMPLCGEQFNWSDYIH